MQIIFVVCDVPRQLKRNSFGDRTSAKIIAREQHTTDCWSLEQGGMCLSCFVYRYSYNY